MGLTEFAEYVIKQAQIEESFDQTDDEDYNRLQNVREFVSAVKEFEENNAGATLQEYLESITLVSDIDSVLKVVCQEKLTSQQYLKKALQLLRK